MYSIMRTDLADDQLRHIILHVAETFGKQAAIDVLNEIEEKISLLHDNPYLDFISHYSILIRKRFRILSVKNNLIFYKVFESESTIMIYAILNERQDYLRIIRDL